MSDFFDLVGTNKRKRLYRVESDPLRVICEECQHVYEAFAIAICFEANPHRCGIRRWLADGSPGNSGWSLNEILSNE